MAWAGFFIARSAVPDPAAAHSAQPLPNPSRVCALSTPGGTDRMLPPSLSLSLCLLPMCTCMCVRAWVGACVCALPQVPARVAMVVIAFLTLSGMINSILAMLPRISLGGLPWLLQLASTTTDHTPWDPTLTPHGTPPSHPMGPHPHTHGTPPSHPMGPHPPLHGAPRITHRPALPLRPSTLLTVAYVPLCVLQMDLPPLYPRCTSPNAEPSPRP
jgi:hypothetical protein